MGTSQKGMAINLKKIDDIVPPKELHLAYSKDNEFSDSIIYHDSEHTRSEVLSRIADCMKKPCIESYAGFGAPATYAVHSGASWLAANKNYKTLYGQQAWNEMDSEVAKRVYDALCAIDIEQTSSQTDLTGLIDTIVTILADVKLNLEHNEYKVQMQASGYPSNPTDAQEKRYQYISENKQYAAFMQDLDAVYTTFKCLSQDFFNDYFMNKHTSDYVNFMHYAQSAWLWFCKYLPELLLSFTEDA